MRIVFFVIILGVIAVIPLGIWISMWIFSVWLLHKLKNLDSIQIKVIQKNQYDDKILEEMK